MTAKAKERIVALQPNKKQTKKKQKKRLIGNRKQVWSVASNNFICFHKPNLLEASDYNYVEDLTTYCGNELYQKEI